MISNTQLIKTVIRLKKPTDSQIGGEMNVIDGIGFRWDKEQQGWVLKNEVVFKPKDHYDMFCRVCKKVEKHIVNKDGTRVKGMDCGTITELKL